MDEDHWLLTEWAGACAEHVLHLFKEQQPRDSRPRDVLGVARAWIRGEVHNAHQRGVPGEYRGARTARLSLAA